MKSFKFVDLFAGLGGFHYALKDLGGECVFVSEIDNNLKDLKNPLNTECRIFPLSFLI